MTRLPVIVTPNARSQITEIVWYIAEDSLNNGLAWEARLIATLDALGGFHGHAIDEDASERAGDQLRKVVFESTYLDHYHVDVGVAVVVSNVRHGARLPRRREP